MSCVHRLLLLVMVLVATAATADNDTFTPEFLAQIAQKYGNSAKERVVDWQHLIESAQIHHTSERDRIHTVNDFFNHIPFVSDLQHWHRTDYWATPVEFLASNGGDCEDFSIAKYFTLREMGVPDDHLRITYVKALRLNEAHMVLAWYETPQSDPLILDNLIPDIEPASRRTDLLPVYSFNGSNLWMSKERGQGRLVTGGSQRINLWRDLNLRMQQRERGRSYTAKSMTQ
ncbi:transglutaminase-like cysteine peptidase [Mariprofundus ferrooxydans]|uniref:Predicted periplasmic protein n=1 Tax=Mariprofundus ferrooxydans PV-1 TaxID=314345 RepID=Q0EZL9_9PROT|nr:predicted periplasmic protein [Mariprofundus ferrooxydans PV-1]KON46987.1 sulfate adenylyltransferase [Mariprofundus ferrooxydans]